MPSTDPLTLGALVVATTALLVAAVAVWRQATVIRRYRQLLQTPAGTDLEHLILTYGAGLDQANARLNALEAGLQETRVAAESHVQHVGVVRFSAFPDVGSDLSYAVALVDHHHNGVIFSSLYGRNECRGYAKPVRNGTSSYKLTDEEKAALAQATRQRLS